MARLRITPLLLLSPALLAVSFVAHAQTHKVNAADSVTRAVGVYEWTGDLAKPTAARLVPVSLYIDGQYEEAAVYLARPVPFALYTGLAYSLDQAGITQGTLNLDNAAHLSSGTETLDNPWIGFGHFVPLAAAAKPAVLRPLANQPAITSNKAELNDNRPRLVNKSDTPAAPARPAPDPSTVGTGAKPSTNDTSASSKNPEDDVDRPTLRRPPPPTKDELKKSKEEDKKNNRASVTAPDRSLNDDPDRPTLRHKASGPSGATGPTELLDLPADMHQLIAVSDAANRPEHKFARDWTDETEHTSILHKLEALAREQLAAYEKLNPLPANAFTPGAPAGPISTPTPAGIATPDTGPPTLKRGVPQTPAPAAAPQTSTTQTTPKTATTPAATGKTTTTASRPMTAAARRKAAAAAAAAPPPPPPTPLLDEDLRGYELSYGADPTFVYTAHTAGAGAAERFVTLIASLDLGTNEIHLSMHSVTDAVHRDRTPEVRIVDAVDAEASNRASLLLEFRHQHSRQFALYRVISGHGDQVFLTGTTR